MDMSMDIHIHGKPSFSFDATAINEKMKNKNDRQGNI